MIYKINGEVASAYNLAGEGTVAYNISGEQVYPFDFSLKVMTYNVGGWYIGSGTNVPSDKYEAFLVLQTGMIEDNDPDVLVIQEYLSDFSSGHPAIDILQSLFPYVHVKTSGTYFGRAICSKYPITEYTERTYTQESNRYFDSCTITVSGIPITFVVTHLGLTQGNRTAEINQLIPFLQQQTHFVIGGDFNTDITPSTSTTESTEYINNVKPFVDAGFNTANFRTGDGGFMVTYIDGSWQGCLDNIYTSPNLSISNVYVDTTKESEVATIGTKLDHMPLIATLTIHGGS